MVQKTRKAILTRISTKCPKALTVLTNLKSLVARNPETDKLFFKNQIETNSINKIENFYIRNDRIMETVEKTKIFLHTFVKSSCTL